MSQKEKKVVHATKYSTWLQKAVYPNPQVHLMVIEVWIKDGQHSRYTLLRIGTIETTELTAETFNRLVEKNAIVEWKPE